MDNLNTHTEQSLITPYGRQKGRRIWRRFTPHYTPTHGSWLNIAELELSLLSRHCLGKRRIENQNALDHQVHGWNRLINRRKVKVNWRFTSRDARRKFGCDSSELKGKR